MENGETLYISNRRDWRTWLRRNHEKKSQIWLIYYKKGSGKPRIGYNDAVEEAVCFGWIDSIVRRIDDQKYAQKFTPRRKTSKWSKSNIKRAEKMIASGAMTSAGLRLYEAKKPVSEKPKSVTRKNPVIPADLRRALAGKPEANRNFKAFAPSYRRNYIAWVMAAKKEDTRTKRIARVVEWSAINQKPGML